MGFDPDTSKDALVRGFTSCDPDDLPIDLPARSLADNIGNKTDVSGKMRTEAFSRYGDKNGGAYVEAYKTAQFGTKPLGQDAEEDGIPDVGSYKKNGQ